MVDFIVMQSCWQYILPICNCLILFIPFIPFFPLLGFILITNVYALIPSPYLRGIASHNLTLFDVCCLFSSCLGFHSPMYLPFWFIAHCILVFIFSLPWYSGILFCCSHLSSFVVNKLDTALAHLMAAPIISSSFLTRISETISLFTVLNIYLLNMHNSCYYYISNLKSAAVLVK